MCRWLIEDPLTCHIPLLWREKLPFVVFGLRMVPLTILLTHTIHVHTHIQMRSVAEGFKLSSVASSAEVKPDCSNKGGPELKQDGHKLLLG